MTKKNLIIVIILLAIIDLVAAGWYMSRRIEASGKSQSLFDQRDSTQVIAMADTVTAANQADVFDKTQHNAYYFVANALATDGDPTSRYTSAKHVKVRWPRSINGSDDLTELNKELIQAAFGNTQSSMKDARYVFLNAPHFNKPQGDDYRAQATAPTVYPTYGNVYQVLVYPYMTSSRLLVMEIDKVEYNGSTTSESSTFLHYDRQKQRVLSRIDILETDASKENKLLKVINKKIDDLNKGRGESNQLQHALNVPAEVRCGRKGIVFQYRQGAISNQPIEVQIDYDKLEPFLTAEFKQLAQHNDSYHTYKEILKPEPINHPTARKAATSTAVKPSTPVVKKKKSYYTKPVKPRQTRRRHYNGARRKSGRYGHAGRGHWSHRQR